ncbi:MAG: hypothetical protein LBB36_00050 [Fibromonadaceae bacterium]|jgi:hypothetical protein|nr:hypothetical protein [Fibromonadaceae bacterium]
MKKILFAAVFAIFASTQAFAIIGVGAHYIMNTGSLKGSNGDISIPLFGDIGVNQHKADGLQGLGFKLWLDFLPAVDIEGTFNITATRYQTSLTFADTTIYLEYSPEAPYNMIFDKASPIYGIATGDLSITYPITDLPIIRPYIGAGLSYFASIPIVNKNFAEKVIINSMNSISIDPTDPNFDPTNLEDVTAQLSDAVVKTLKDTDYETGFGAHIIVGARFKLPVIPIAAYANAKRYFGGNTSSQFSQGFVFELGGGFAL